MRDPYDVLGVQRSAKPAAIKSAFRRLAKKLHPDANRTDPKAAERFAEINSAYEILGDEAKRRAFDAGEIDAEGKPIHPAFEGFGAQPGGGFGRDGRFETFTWGPGGFERGSGAGAGGAAGFEDVLSEMFGRAGGAGQRFQQGRRSTFQFDPEDFGPPPTGRDVAVAVTIALSEAAKGTSRRVTLPTGKEVEVKIPAGLADGQQIRLKGQGLPGAGAPGDALITVHVADDPRFKREPQKSGAGDLLATVRIVLPEGRDEALEELMRTWRDQKPYDPRKDLG
jgi:DnaJ-class molecular chaperone